VITPKDGSNYMCATLRDPNDGLVTTTDWEASYGKYENLLGMLTEELSDSYLYSSNDPGFPMRVPELKK